MSVWFTSLTILQQITVLYALFLFVFAGYLLYEIKRSPLYADDEMRERIIETPRKDRRRTARSPSGSVKKVQSDSQGQVPAAQTERGAAGRPVPSDF